ncbi:MAG: sigma-70 family RNA polymerase sigma factor [Thermoanaerobaculia bacterium]|nr:sigma-70 family RNA polymerase sigma factor [Thermoanaerobaculia bacterium]
MTHHFEDLRLVRRVLRGEESAFEEFFGHYFPGLFRFAAARLGDESMAEEVAQQTLCVAMGKLASYRGEAALFSWLCTFCRHEMFRALRSSGKAAQPVGLAEDLPQVRGALESLFDVSAMVGGPDDELDRRELARWVRRLLDQLPRRYGHALRWKYLDELSVRQIAERLGITPKAAESVLSRARVAFRDALSTLGPDAAALLARAAAPNFEAKTGNSL